MSELSVGSRWNMLTLVSEPFHVAERHSRYVTVVCDCSAEFKMSMYTFKLRRGKGACRSCACRQGDSALKTYFSSYKRSAKSRGLGFSLDLEEFRRLVSGECDYCGIAPCRGIWSSNRNDCQKFNGVDRVDSSIGYLVDNCVSCCTECNYMKRDMSKIDFIEKCRAVVKNNE